MGLYDRDYLQRDDRGSGMRGGVSMRGGGGQGMFNVRSWSVNAWLIAICVAVFAIDALLPPQLVFLGTVPVGMPEGATPEPVDRMTLMTPPLDAKRVPPASSRVFLIPLMQKDPNGQLGPATVAWTLRNADGTQRGVSPIEAAVRSAGPLFGFGYFSTSRALVTFDPSNLVPMGFQFWRFISFQFLHADLMHLMFNMLGLFIFGGLVEQYLGSKRYLAFYLLCGIAGAAMYLLLNLVGWTGYTVFGIKLPLVLISDPATPLIGASAGVFGVLMACAFLVPNATVYLFFVLPMRLATLAYGLVVIALLAVFLGWTNAGGEAAHLGGAIAGWGLIRRPNWLHGFFDFLGRFDPWSRSNAARRAVRSKNRGGEMKQEAEIDRILSKIHESGLQSLTKREQKILREASRR